MKTNLRIPDPWLIWLALAATALGFIFVFDAGYARSLLTDRGPLPNEFRIQLMLFVPALLLGAFCARVQPARWLSSSTTFWIVCFIGLIVVMKFGHEMNGARRWVKLGPVNVQPAEFAKLGAILYLAAVFSKRKKLAKPKPPRQWFEWLDRILLPKVGRALPALWVAFGAVLIVKEPDLGTGAIVACVAFLMFFPAGVSKASLAIAVGVSIFAGVWMVQMEPYRMERIVNHANRWSPKNVDDTSYQTVQSELAIASGGVLGVGFGNGHAKHLIPAPTTDFIMATVGEELGLMGSLVVLAVLGALVWRLLWQAGRAKTTYARLVLYGIGTWIGVQTCVNFMMANGFLPAIGIPLPFVSSGGSSLIALWMAIGIGQSMIRMPEAATPSAPDRAAVNAAGLVGPRRLTRV